jgi:putative sigma-54 modulation protein
MKVSYRGIQKDLPVNLQEKLDARFAKLSKLVDGRGEKQAHVVVSTERHLHKAEITVRGHDRQLVGIGSDPDLFSALAAALDKIEKQAVNHGQKWRATTRRSEPMKTAAANAAPLAPPRKKVPPDKKTSRKTAAGSAAGATPRVFRPTHHERRKPITLEEALLHMEDGRDYLVYRDADKQSLFMLVRRRDGHFDLIES